MIMDEWRWIEIAGRLANKKDVNMWTKRQESNHWKRMNDIFYALHNLNLRIIEDWLDQGICSVRPWRKYLVVLQDLLHLWKPSTWDARLCESRLLSSVSLGVWFDQSDAHSFPQFLLFDTWSLQDNLGRVDQSESMAGQCKVLRRTMEHSYFP